VPRNKHPESGCHGRSLPGRDGGIFPSGAALGKSECSWSVPESPIRYEIKSDLQRGRFMEDTRMCHNSEEPGQCKIRQTIACVAVHNTSQPVSIALVTSGVGPMGVYKDVNVDENQGWAP